MGEKYLLLIPCIIIAFWFLKRKYLSEKHIFIKFFYKSKKYVVIVNKDNYK